MKEKATPIDEQPSTSFQNTVLENNSISVDFLKKKASPKISPRTSPMKLILESDPEQKNVNSGNGSAIFKDFAKLEKQASQHDSSFTLDKPEPFKTGSHNNTSGDFPKGAKPPNVLVFSDSIDTRNNVVAVLKSILDRDM